VEELEGYSADAVGLPADVSRPGDVEGFVERSAAGFGGVDLLVANVGGTSGGTLMESTREDWERTLNLNLIHAVDAVRAAVPFMIQRGGEEYC
jgi:3-oxoacyl-[acyl-carrier protein] reductase